MLFRFISACGYCPHCLFLPSFSSKRIKFWWILSFLICQVKKRCIGFSLKLTKWIRNSIKNNKFSHHNMYSFKMCERNIAGLVIYMMNFGFTTVSWIWAINTVNFSLCFICIKCIWNNNAFHLKAEHLISW